MNSNNPAVREILGPLVAASLWMKLLGGLMILSGALQVLTIVGILWGWLPIWLGVLLFQASSAADNAVASESVTEARTAIDKIRLFFMIQGVMLLIMLLVVVAFMILGGGAMMMAAMSGAAAR